MSQPLHTHIVQGAIDIISDESRWCKGAAARDQYGRRVDFYHPAAAQFCALGAISAVAHNLIHNEAERQDICSKITMELRDSGVDIVELNDKHGREAAIAALKTYLEKAHA